MITRDQKYNRRYREYASGVKRSISKVARAGRTGNQMAVWVEQIRHAGFMETVRWLLA